MPDVGSYLAVALDEAEKSKNGPVKAGVLTTLLLLACVFGATFEWLLTFVRKLGVFARWRIALLHPNVAALRRDTPFLGVFRL